jgi:hypothetical protein
MNRYWILFTTVGFAIADSRTAPAQATDTRSQPPKTSYQLIDDALVAKRINDETAHKYRVFAAFGDSRLPTEYRGTDHTREPPQVVLKVGALMKTFSRQTQDELAPFFMRPDQPGSWINLSTVSEQSGPPGAPPPSESGDGFSSVPLRRASSSTFFRVAGPRSAGPFPSTPGNAHRGGSVNVVTWRKFPAVNGKAMVWAQDRYPGDSAKADGLARALTNHIWPTLTNLMHREPVPDTGLAINGGGGAVDFYLVHAPIKADKDGTRSKVWDGVTWTADESNPCGPKHYIKIDSNLPLGSTTSPGILNTAAHELMHAIAFAYGVTDNNGCGMEWIHEASASWAENFVYPQVNDEHKYAKTYLTLPHVPIENADGTHHYGAYLLPYFVEKESGRGPQIMPAIWTQFKKKTALEGINDELSGGWDKQWPQFLIANVNQPPVDRYRSWDHLADTAFRLRHDVDVRAGVVTINLDFPFAGLDATGAVQTGLDYLAGWYHKFKFQPNVRMVVFENTIADLGQPHSSVWGLQKIRGTWKKAEDWTRDFSKTWCRDNAKEDIEELVIIFGNSDWQTKKVLKPPKDPQVKAYPTGCAAWEGTMVVTTTAQVLDQGSTITEVTRATMRFVVDTSKATPGQPAEYWKVVSGTLSWEDRFTGTCTGSMSGSRAIQDRGGGNEEALLRIWDDGGKLVASGVEGPWPTGIPLPTYTVKCPEKPDATMTLLSGGVGVSPKLSLGVELARDGKSFKGDDLWEMTPMLTKRIQYTFHVSP